MVAEIIERAVAVSIAAALFLAICIILRSRGWRVVLLACVFVASLVSTQLAMKMLESKPYNYKFAGFVTCVHFAGVSIVCYGYWLFWMKEPMKCLPTSIGSWRRYFRTVVVIAFSMPVSVIFNNKAMEYVGAGVCAIIGTLSPVCTALLSRFFGRRMSLLSAVGVLVAFGGGVVISWSELTQVGDIGGKDSARTAISTGLGLAFLSLTGRSAKIVVMDQVLSPMAYADEGEAREETIAPLHLYVLQFPLSLVLSFLWSLRTEDIHKAWAQLTMPIVWVILFTAANALVLNFVGLYVLKEFGATAQQIVGKLNTICIASLSVAFLGEQLPALVVAGSGLVLGGVAIFEKGTGDAESGSSSIGSSEGSDSEQSIEEAKSAARAAASPLINASVEGA